MKKFLGNTLFGIYAIIAIFVTICLLSYNQYKVTEFGDYSLLIINNDSLQPEFNSGDLAIINGKEDINVGDEIFFYNTNSENIEISLAKVTDMEKVEKDEVTYTLSGDYKISSEYVIGNINGSAKMPVVGNVLGFWESKWGFLLLVVFPSLLAFIYQITVVYSEIKEIKREEKNSDKIDKETTQNKQKANV